MKPNQWGDFISHRQQYSCCEYYDGLQVKSERASSPEVNKVIILIYFSIQFCTQDIVVFISRCLFRNLNPVNSLSKFCCICMPITRFYVTLFKNCLFDYSHKIILCLMHLFFLLVHFFNFFFT